MATIDEVFNRYNKIDLVQIAKDVVTANEQAVLEINRTQLEYGYDSDGIRIVPKYASQQYAELKASFGSKAPFRTPDLLLTGRFYHSFKFDNNFKVYSAGVPYAQWLEHHYGKNIYGFNDKNLNQVRKLYKDEIKKRIEL
ncbi:MAG: hypothetical protein LBS43_07425 [Prevotellaceae bacterium]|nr:hypothetical protein [Prevotellaceae bacterium]